MRFLHISAKYITDPRDPYGIVKKKVLVDGTAYRVPGRHRGRAEYLPVKKLLAIQKSEGYDRPALKLRDRRKPKAPKRFVGRTAHLYHGHPARARG